MLCLPSTASILRLPGERRADEGGGDGFLESVFIDFEPGTVWMFKEGEIVAQATTVRGVKSEQKQATR